MMNGKDIAMTARCGLFGRFHNAVKGLVFKDGRYKMRVGVLDLQIRLKGSAAKAQSHGQNAVCQKVEPDFVMTARRV
jgi:hypothetical protein